MAGADRQRAELVEGETAIQEIPGHVLNAVDLGVLVGIFGLLPGARALEGDPVFAQDLPQPFPADPDRSDPVAGQVVGELAETPVRERLPQSDGACPGRRDDELAFVIADQGTASRPPRPSAARPLSLNALITSRTVSSWAVTSRAIAVTGVPDVEAVMIRAVLSIGSTLTVVKAGGSM